MFRLLKNSGRCKDVYSAFLPISSYEMSYQDNSNAMIKGLIHIVKSAYYWST